MKLKALAEKFVQNLASLYDSDEAMSLFLLVLKHHLNLNRTDYLLKREEEIPENEQAEFENILNELVTGKPIQYILGETTFYGLTFKVNPSVLIPRPETEELVHWILEKINSQLPTPNSKLLDIGTGSGCIAISLKKDLLQLDVYALDIASDTLTTARENALLNKVDVNFIEEDILKIDHIQDQTFSVIVSNPPYVKEDEKGAMHPNVLANEPHRALFVSDENPLLFYDAIANFALKSLKKNGLLFFEINEYLGKQTVDLLIAKGFKNIELRKDMQGKDRMICCEKP